MDLSLFQTVNDQDDTVEAARPETKSFNDVLQCINHHAGNNDAVVDRFIEMALLGEQWDWYENEYKPWLARRTEIEEWNESREADDEGNMPESMPLPEMPEPPAQTTVEQWRLSNASLLRRGGFGDWREQMDKMHPDPDRWQEFIVSRQRQYPKGMTQGD